MSVKLGNMKIKDSVTSWAFPKTVCRLRMLLLAGQAREAGLGEHCIVGLSNSESDGSFFCSPQFHYVVRVESAASCSCEKTGCHMLEV